MLATLRLVVLRLKSLHGIFARFDRVVTALGHWLDLVDADSGHEFSLTVRLIYLAMYSH